MSVAIYDLIIERSLGPKAQALEDANGLGLVRNHFGHNLFQARLLREIEDGLRQYMRTGSPLRRRGLLWGRAQRSGRLRHDLEGQIARVA